MRARSSGRCWPQVRSLSEAEEEELLQCSSPYLQGMVTFAISTVLRLGEF
jgi:hypothetical protein